MKANPTTIGLFVLGGLALTILAVLALGGTDWFHRRTLVVSYFPGSVQGLSVGAPVEFRGVPVGKVSQIKLEVDLENLSAVIPVIMEIDPQSWRYIGAPGRRLDVQAAVLKGLRAQLAQQSFVTGQVLVELDLRPDTPARLFKRNDQGLPEIPSIKSEIETLKETLTALPLEAIAVSLQRVVTELDKLLGAPELPGILKNLEATATSANSLMSGLKDDRVKLVEQLRATLAEFDKAASGLQGVSLDAQKTLRTVDQVTATDLRKALRSAEATLQQTERTFAATADMLAPDSADRVQISRILDNVLYAMQSLRRLADELERKPNSVIFGR